MCGHARAYRCVALAQKVLFFGWIGVMAACTWVEDTDVLAVFYMVAAACIGLLLLTILFICSCADSGEEYAAISGSPPEAGRDANDLQTRNWALVILFAAALAVGLYRMSRMTDGDDAGGGGAGS